MPTAKKTPAKRRAAPRKAAAADSRPKPAAAPRRAAKPAEAREVLLIGSLAVANAEAAMSAAASIGPALTRIPDGETGARSKFVTWQVPVLAKAEQFEVMPLGPQSEWGPNGQFPPRIVRLKPGYEGTPHFPPTGYADAALDSYRTFKRLKQAGRIAPDVRFQVGLPTPLGVLAVFMEPDAQRLAEPPYRRRLIEDLDRIVAGVPHDELAVQWDVPEEIGVWEDIHAIHAENPREAVVRRLVELMDRVHPAVELGLHLCYGDISHKHWKEPDIGVMAAFTNAVTKALKRKLDYVHMPIPRDWTEPARYAGLRKFKLAPGTKIYLGLIHATDGAAGAAKRIAAASRHLKHFGVGTSCGLGRRDPAAIPGLLALHREVAALG